MAQHPTTTIRRALGFYASEGRVETDDYAAALLWLWDQSPAEERVRYCKALAREVVKRENLAARMILDNMLTKVEVVDNPDRCAERVMEPNGVDHVIKLDRAWVMQNDQRNITAVIAHELAHLFAEMMRRLDERLLEAREDPEG